MARFHAEYVTHDEDLISLSSVEQDICGYIAQDQQDDYERWIAQDQRWKVFYHLTRMRKSLLNWYRFVEGATLLELDGGFGALTGLYCDRCKEVVSIERFLHRAEQIYERHKTRNNLTVYAGRIDDIPLEPSFDYITLIGSLEFRGEGKADRKIYADYLRKAKRFLKPDGKLLIAVENRFGLRYFCGTLDPHTGVPFAGINGYPQGSAGRSFSKQELIDIIRQAGFRHYKFYYPLPDYKLPQVIFSDEYIPPYCVKERVFPYYHNSSTLVAVERELYADIIENEVFDFFANSFLVECFDEGEVSDVMFAALSTDRGREEAFATTIHQDGTVRKKPLWPEGKFRLEAILCHHQELQARGLRVVDSRIDHDELVMPHIAANKLSEYLKMIVRREPDRYIQLFDQLYACILESSEHVSSVNDSLLFFDRHADYGVILAKAYTDMVPVNCFYDQGSFIFFDQEFVMERYPAKYVLYRALKYTYLFDQSAEEVVPLESLKQKYGLTNLLWEVFEKVERMFVSANRKYDENRSFFAKTYVNLDRIYENARYLMR